MYEALTGHCPFESESLPQLLVEICNAPLPAPRERDTNIPEEVDALIVEMLARDREERIENARTLAHRLAMLAPGDLPSVMPSMPTVSTRRQTPEPAFSKPPGSNSQASRSMPPDSGRKVSESPTPRSTESPRTSRGKWALLIAALLGSGAGVYLLASPAPNDASIEPAGAVSPSSRLAPVTLQPPVRGAADVHGAPTPLARPPSERRRNGTQTNTPTPSTTTPLESESASPRSVAPDSVETRRSGGAMAPELHPVSTTATPETDEPGAERNQPRSETPPPQQRDIIRFGL